MTPVGLAFAVRADGRVGCGEIPEAPGGRCVVCQECRDGVVSASNHQAFYGLEREMDDAIIDILVSTIRR